jgi:D-aminopeptidase
MTDSANNAKPRARDLGLDFGGASGAHNAITDVPGVLVGYETLNGMADSGLPVKTGVTAILPRGFDPTPRPVWAGQFSLNGNGEMTGSHWVRDGGYLVGPILVTNTHSVGSAHQAAVRWMIQHYGETWTDHHLWAMPVVAETYDGVLNDINGLHVREEHVLAAIRSARPGPVAEGNVGGGNGMICYEFKGGSGTASRTLAVDGQTFTVGAFVQANHGVRDWLTVLGVPVGRHLQADRIPDFPAERGSIIVILGTDLPLNPSQLERLARRASIGIGRGGTPGGNNSGDIFLAFSVANAMPLPQLDGPWRRFTSLNDELLDPVYLAAVQAVEEAVVNVLLAAGDTPTARPPGAVCRALRADELLEVMRRHGR